MILSLLLPTLTEPSLGLGRPGAEALLPFVADVAVETATHKERRQQALTASG